MKNLEINIANINYQKWKETINHFLLYNYFKDEAQQSNQNIQKRMKVLEEKKETISKEELEEYQKLIEETLYNSFSIGDKVQKNFENKELLEKLYQEKNVDISIESYNRWLQTGEKIKI